MASPAALRTLSQRSRSAGVGAGAAQPAAAAPTMQALLGSAAWAPHQGRPALVVPGEEGAGEGAGVLTYSGECLALGGRSGGAAQGAAGRGPPSPPHPHPPKTHAELDQAALSVQRQLAALDLAPGAVAAVLAPPASPEACLLLLACLRAGLVLAPLSPALAAVEQLEYCLNDTRAALLLASRGRGGGTGGRGAV